MRGSRQVKVSGQGGGFLFHDLMSAAVSRLSRGARAHRARRLLLAGSCTRLFSFIRTATQSKASEQSRAVASTRVDKSCQVPGRRRGRLPSVFPDAGMLPERGARRDTLKLGLRLTSDSRWLRIPDARMRRLVLKGEHFCLSGCSRLHRHRTAKFEDQWSCRVC